MLSPCFQSFHLLNKLEYSENLLGMRFRISCNQHNLQFGEKTLSDRLYSHPRGPFQGHLKGMLGRIVCIRCRCHRSLLRETKDLFEPQCIKLYSIKWVIWGNYYFAFTFVNSTHQLVGYEIRNFRLCLKNLLSKKFVLLLQNN